MSRQVKERLKAAKAAVDRKDFESVVQQCEVMRLRLTVCRRLSLCTECPSCSMHTAVNITHS